MISSKKREPKIKVKRSLLTYPTLIGKLFQKQGSQRVWILLFDNGWVLCGAWSGLKEYNPHNIPKRQRYVGYINDDLLNTDNYYRIVEVKTKAKTEEKLINAIKALGYIELV